MRTALSIIILLVLIVFGTLRVSFADETGSVDFNRDIRPVLSRACFACHGQDEEKREAGLRLDHRDAALATLESDLVAIVPGHPDQSELFQRIATNDEDARMPPVDTGIELTADERETIRRWIEQGAEYADHWAFNPPVRWPVPNVQNSEWPANQIDGFILARLEQAGLKPSPRGNRYALIRRVSLDLRGLPPTPNEVEQFLADSSPNAYGKLVDRFLGNPAFGERWARMWLDLARYADSKGYGSDPLRKIWLYRDWVINAFNRNISYDQFTTEQIAGDLLPNPSIEQRIATAFHRNTMTNTEGGTDDEEFRTAAVKDRVDTTVQVWMGLTMGCAKCHSHKYDPITQHEYYRFYAYFNQTADADRNDEAPTLPVPNDDIALQIDRVDVEIAALTARFQSETPNRSLADEIKRLEKSKPKFPTVPVMQELPADEQRVTNLMIKGSFLNKGDAVDVGLPNAFHPADSGAPGTRLAVANWLTDENNPLTARVAMNRFWAQLFGAGLVPTEEDFGTQGEPPSHPRLLDWLATEFVRQQWNMKAMLRLMVTSETYCQTSRITPELLDADPRNRLLSRGARFRLEAEMVRDQAMALSGLLSRKMSGPSVFPPQPKGLWRAAFNGADRKWPTSEGADRYRRGLYTFWRRTVPFPSMETFDAPSREVCSMRRIRTNTPLQAFVTLNDPAYVEAAQSLARRIVREGRTSVEERAQYALQLCLIRPPSSQQINSVTALYASELEHYRSNTSAAEAMATEPFGPLPDGWDPHELAAWTVVANMLLNLDAVLMRG